MSKKTVPFKIEATYQPGSSPTGIMTTVCSAVSSHRLEGNVRNMDIGVDPDGKWVVGIIGEIEYNHLLGAIYIDFVDFLIAESDPASVTASRWFEE